jgi:hypothetical protein
LQLTAFALEPASRYFDEWALKGLSNRGQTVNTPEIWSLSLKRQAHLDLTAIAFPQVNDLTRLSPGCAHIMNDKAVTDAQSFLQREQKAVDAKKNEVRKIRQ